MRLEICLYLLYREHRERGQEGTKDRGEGRHTDVRDARDVRDVRDARDARDKEERDERRGPELKESRLDATVRKYLKGTVSWGRFQKYWQKFTELGLTKGRGWFLNFLGAPMILKGLSHEIYFKNVDKNLQNLA
jgi:hypothetical protein